MKPKIALLLLSILGLICGCIAGLLRTAFIINCGETCPDEPFTYALYGAIALPFIGYFILRKAWEKKLRFVLVAIGLSIAIILPALFWYGHELHTRYKALYKQTPTTDLEYSQMIIAEKPLPAINIAEGERCAMGSTFCEDTPRTISAHCRNGVVQITEKYWASFKRLPAEDLRGLIPDDSYKDFPKNICTK